MTGCQPAKCLARGLPGGGLAREQQFLLDIEGLSLIRPIKFESPLATSGKGKLLIRGCRRRGPESGAMAATQ